MFEKLEIIAKRYDELETMIGDPAIIADQTEWQKLVKEHSSYEEQVSLYREYKSVCDSIAECEEIIKDNSDADMVELAHEELGESKKRLPEIEEKIKIALIPKDPNDDKNVVIEIRAGAGGDEAGLFGTELMRMYMRFAERMRWKVRETDMNMTDIGGVKECTFIISGTGAYSMLKFESGVHRVQRVPETESQGRIHTSTATVAVLPEVEDVEVDIQDKDIKIDTYRSSGAGGQHVNKTESAIRITHFPTGIVVTCQDEKSQIKNRETAMKILKSRLYDHYQQEINSKYAANRRSQVGTGDRSERIRTYNFPQGRVTDHRIGLTLYSLESFLDGDIFEMIEALQLADQTAKLTALDD